MGTTTVRRSASTSAVSNPNALQDMLAGLITEKDIIGEGQGPLYDLRQVAGVVKPINTPASALAGDFFANRNAIPVGGCAYVQGQFGNTQLAMRLSEKGVVFAGIRHDAEGNPVHETELTVCAVVTNREFEIPGEDAVIAKGTNFLKALPAKYVASLKAA